MLRPNQYAAFTYRRNKVENLGLLDFESYLETTEPRAATVRIELLVQTAHPGTDRQDPEVPTKASLQPIHAVID